MQLPVYQIDAFTQTPFTGNPAAIMPLEQWLPDTLMQNIAMENNLAETAFVVAHPAGHASGAHYHIRWFTPALEIDLCGHATVAAAMVLHRQLGFQGSQIVFSTQKAGLLRVNIEADGWYVLDFPSRPPEPCATPDGLLQALGLQPQQVVEVRKSRDYFVVLDAEDTVRQLQPDFGALKKIPDATGVIVTARSQTEGVVSRCFYPIAGIDEDPVTGSAHCNIIPYWCGVLQTNQLLCRQVSARGGVLKGSLHDDRVHMAGQAVQVLQGYMFLP